MKKNLLIFTLIILSIFILGGCTKQDNEQYRAEGSSLNTYVSITLYGCGSSEIAENALKLCDYYEKILSRTDSDSLLYKLNNEGHIYVDSPEAEILSEVISIGIEYGKLTNGALDITIEPLSSLWNFGSGNESVPKPEDINVALKKVDYNSVEITDKEIMTGGARIDLGAVAKGYIGMKIRDYLLEQGADSALINLGGNIICVGNKAEGTPFRIGIQRPFEDTSDVIASLSVSDMSIVTSGVYERYFREGDDFYHHILNPDTGYPCDNGLLSVTVISEDSTACDCLSTGLFVLGMEEARKLADSLAGVYAIFVDEDYNIYYSENAEQFLSK